MVKKTIKYHQCGKCSKILNVTVLRKRDHFGKKMKNELFVPLCRMDHDHGQALYASLISVTSCMARYGNFLKMAAWVQLLTSRNINLLYSRVQSSFK